MTAAAITRARVDEAQGWWAALRRTASERYGRILFWAVFAIPTLLAALFYGLVAADRYVSETRFVVRSVDQPVAEGAAALLQDFGIAQTNDDAFAVQDFIHSRDMMRALMRTIDLRAVYTRPEADFVTRYRRTGARDTDEAFYRYFVEQVDLVKDLETGITTVRVQAYRARDAKAIADAIIRLSEIRVNAMNERARRDAVAAAQANVREASDRLVAANVALTQVRNRAETVDPALTAGEALDRAGGTEAELAMLRVELAGMLAKTPGNPAIPATRQRIAALEAQSGQQRAAVTGGRDALSNSLAGYEAQLVRRTLAEKGYEAAERQLERALQDAARQQIYLETIARPGLPDEATEPRRLRYWFTVALLSFWAFLIVYLLVSGSRDHLNLE